MDQDHDPFLVTSPRAIASVLRTIHQRNALLHMRLAAHEQALVTTLLDLDANEQSITVDASANPQFNRRILEPGRVLFSTVVDKVRVQFTVNAPAQAIEFQQRDALRLAYPHALRRIQRRDHFRIDIPVSQPVYCQIPFSAGQVHTLQIKDLSAGGVALLDPDELIDATVGTRLNGCQIVLPDLGAIQVDLTVRRMVPKDKKSGQTRSTLACQFNDLSTAHEIMVVNYLGQLERQLNARRRGFD